MKEVTPSCLPNTSTYATKLEIFYEEDAERKKRKIYDGFTLRLTLTMMSLNAIKVSRERFDSPDTISCDRLLIAFLRVLQNGVPVGGVDGMLHHQHHLPYPSPAHTLQPGNRDNGHRKVRDIRT